VERAKIFHPFDALSGLREALSQQEHIVVPRAELSEDELYELDWKIHSLKAGDMVSVVYYATDNYLRKTGIVSYINCNRRQFSIAKQTVPLEDICRIDILERGVF